MRKPLLFFLAVLFLIPAVASAATVVTSFYPVWLLTLNLTGGLDEIDVRNLAAPETGCLHDYALMPSDMTVLSVADALLINGAGMESFLPMVLEACPDLPVIDASEGIELLAEEGEEDENSHIWLDPVRASAMAENLADGLICIMPEYEETIRSNLVSLQTRLSDLAAVMKSSVAGLPAREVIIMHEAFPYFAEACNLPVIEVVDKEPEDNLPASRLVELIRICTDSNPLPLVIRSVEEDPAVSVLAAETGVPVCTLKTLASGPENPPPDYYEQTMLENLRLVTAAISD